MDDSESSTVLFPQSPDTPVASRLTPRHGFEMFLDGKDMEGPLPGLFFEHVSLRVYIVLDRNCGPSECRPGFTHNQLPEALS